MKDKRKTQYLKEGVWVDVGLMDVQVGDIIRMFESTGEPVVDNDGFSQFKVFDEPFHDENNIATVKAEQHES